MTTTSSLCAIREKPIHDWVYWHLIHCSGVGWWVREVGSLTVKTLEISLLAQTPISYYKSLYMFIALTFVHDHLLNWRKDQSFTSVLRIVLVPFQYSLG